MERWPITAVAVSCVLFASALEIHLHHPSGSGAGGPNLAVDVSPAERDALDRPDDADAWVALAEVYAEAGRIEDATRAFGQARRVDPDHPSVVDAPEWFGGAGILEVEREVLLDPTNDEAWGRAADAIAAAGDRTRAVSYYLRALELDPSDGEWPGKLMAQGPDPRIDTFLARWAATAGDRDDEALGDIADGMKSAGRWRDACAFYGKALAADPSDNEWVQAIDECARRYPADFQPAAEYALSALRERAATSSDDELVGDYADALRDAGRRSEACAQYARAASLDPADNEWIRALLACPGHALDLDAIRREAGGDDEQLGDLADSLWAMERHVEACEIYREASRLDPSDDEWREAVRRCP